MKTSFFTKEELKEIGFKNLGENVLISRKSSIYSPEKISIGNNVRIDDFCILSGNIILGNYIHIAAFCALYGSEGIEMKDFSGLSSRVSIYSSSDDYSGNYLTNPMVPDKFRNIIKGRVVLEKHAIVGASSVILPGVIIREGAAIGTMSLVNKDCEAWTINIGIPSKIIKKREKRIPELEKIFILEN